MTEKEQKEFEEELVKLLDGPHGLLYKKHVFRSVGEIIPKELRGEKRTITLSCLTKRKKSGNAAHAGLAYGGANSTQARTFPD